MKRVRNRLVSSLRMIAVVFLIFVFVFSPALPTLLERAGVPRLAEETRVQDALAAPPAYRSSGAFRAATGAITPPYPADMAADDVCLLAVESENQTISLTTANGFVQVPTWSPQSAGSAATNPASRLALYWKRTVGGDAAPVVADSGNHVTGRIHCFSGVLTSGNPWDTGAGGNDGAANDTSATVPGSTTTVADTLVVLITSTSNNATSTANCSAWTNADLANLTEQADNTNTAGLGGGHCMATGEKATAGSYATTTVTFSATSYKGAISLALKPGVPTMTVSGTAYEDETGTVWSGCDGATNRVSLRIGGVTYGPVSCPSETGALTFSGVTQPGAGTAMTLWFDNVAANFGSRVNRYSGTGNVAGFNVRRNRVIVMHDDTGPITNTDLDNWDNGDDADINFVVTASNLTVEDGSKLIVNIDDTFTPGGAVTTDPSASASSLDGDLLISTGATLSMGVNALFVGGDYDNQGTFLKSAGQTTTFTATAPGHVIVPGAGNFENVTFGQ